MVNNWILGVRYALSGFNLITQKGLKKFAIIPLLLNTLFFIALFFIAKHFWHELVIWIENFLPTWLQWTQILLWLVFSVGFFLIAILTSVTATNLIATPFNTFLAEKVTRHLTGHEQNSQTLIKIIADVPRAIGRQIAIIGYYLPRLILLFVLLLIPVIQLAALFFWFLFNAWFITVQCIDYPSDNQRVSLKEVKRKLRANKGMVFGFGSMILVIAAVPILNFITIPVAVAGATKMWVEKIQNA